jgi:hypothetical protein
MSRKTVTFDKSQVEDIGDTLDSILDNWEEESETEDFPADLVETIDTRVDDDSSILVPEIPEPTLETSQESEVGKILDGPPPIPPKKTPEETEIKVVTSDLQNNPPSESVITEVTTEDTQEATIATTNIVSNPILKHKIEQSIIIDKEPMIVQPTVTSEEPPEKIPEPTPEELEKQLQNTIEKSKELMNQLEESNEFIKNKSVCQDLAHVEFYLMKPLIVPNGMDIYLDVYINSITEHSKYSWKNKPLNNMYNIPEKMVIINKLGEVFNSSFIADPKNPIDFQASVFSVLSFANASELPCLNLERHLIAQFLNKLIIAINTRTERAFSETRSTVNPRLKTVLSKARLHLEMLASKYSLSLQTSITELIVNTFDEGDNKFVYNHKSFKILNDIMMKAWNQKHKGPLFENLTGSILKCYFPSFIIDYFNSIVAVYIIARLVSIYLQTPGNLSKSEEEIETHLKTIAMFGVAYYEDVDYLYKGVARAFPKFTHQLSAETEMYYLHHLFTGPQYALLKELEFTIPKINKIVKLQ